MKQEWIAGMVIGLIGLGLVIIPIGKLWTFTEKWKTKNGQPSKAYSILMRVLGVFFTALGVVLIVWGL